MANRDGPITATVTDDEYENEQVSRLMLSDTERVVYLGIYSSGVDSFAPHSESGDDLLVNIVGLKVFIVDLADFPPGQVSAAEIVTQ